MLKGCFYHALELPSLQNHDPNKLLFCLSYPLVLSCRKKKCISAASLPVVSAGGIGPDRAGSNWESLMNEVRYHTGQQ